MKIPALTAIALSLIIFAPPAIPQDQTVTTARKQQAQARLEEIKQRLALTPEQTEQVRAVLADEIEQLRELREKSGGAQNRRARRGMAKEARRIRDAANEKLKTILSKTQMEELTKLRKEWRDERGRRQTH